ncbi:MAG: hypothetical protein ACLP52_10650 [Streptosporangiaceae bacterium]
MLLTAAPGPPIAQASHHRIGVSWQDECRDLFQVQFHRSGIFVHFCYQPDAPGIMNRIELQPGRTHTFEVTHSADATTRKVKYDHPVDGQAHFSQDGRIVTSVRNQAERLEGSTGHIFSLDIAGIRLFRKCTTRTTARTASAQITFSLEPFDPLHVAGFWFVLQPGSTAGDITNPVMVDLGTGRQQGLATAPPPGSQLDGGILVLFPRRATADLAVGPGEFRLIFTGGFAHGLADPSIASSFLALQYPLADISSLRLADFRPPDLTGEAIEVVTSPP